MMHTNNSSFLILFIGIGIFVVIEIINLYSLFVHRSTKKKITRIIIRIIISACIFLFICFLIFALIWLTPRKSREYIKSYDNIFYYMEDEENMDMFQTSICTAVFDGSRYYYFHHDLHLNNKDDLNNYCSILYELLNNYINGKEDFS